jgi:regulator of sigma E protease
LVGTIFLIILFLVIFSAVLLIHEFGHFIVAKIARIRVLEFGLGFPPRLWGFNVGGTVYSINLIPFGAFVKMPGEDDEGVPGAFANTSSRTRLAVLAAGPIMNVLLAIALFTTMFMVPRDVPVGSLIVQEVSNNSVARVAGIRPGDAILRVDGAIVKSGDELQSLVNAKKGMSMEWIVERSSDQVPIAIKPNPNPEENQWKARDVLVGTVVITRVEDDSPAKNAGIKAGDIIVEIDGYKVGHHTDLSYLIRDYVGDAMVWVIERDGERYPIPITPRLDPERGKKIVGIGISTIDFRVLGLSGDSNQEGRIKGTRIDTLGLNATFGLYKIEKVSSSFLPAIAKAMNRMGEILGLIKTTFTDWASGGQTPEFTGPIGIGHVFVELGQLEGVSIASRVREFLQLTALISMLLAVSNFLPIPALDGGRIFFVLLEIARRGKRISPKKEGVIHFVGFSVMISLMILVTFSDFSKLGDNLLGG